MADKNLKNSTHNSKNGRFVLGGTTETSLFALEWWERIKMPRHASDIVYVVEKKYEGRPDLLGYVFYADPGLWWFICQYNSVLDPIEELVEGKILLIPTKDRMKKELLAQTGAGGTPSTRGK